MMRSLKRYRDVPIGGLLVAGKTYMNNININTVCACVPVEAQTTHGR
jgi:hypothetical protein